MADILSELNKEQRKAVETIEGPLMVIAGAGSGKTRVLTYRTAHLINLGTEPYHILALTFTNKAAREMRERITRLAGNNTARDVWMGTFHSIFARILRREAHHLGFPPNFTIYDSEDTKRVIRSVVKENMLDEKLYATGYIHYRISAVKNNLITAKDYISNPDFQTEDQLSGKPLFGKVFNDYAFKCYKSSAMDFDDLLLNMYRLISEFPDMLARYQQLFRYILVDEYQDTNHAQYMVLKMLAAMRENICVVGDDAQSIYGFRGANIQNILNFNRDYPDAAIIKLEQNYRSTGVIVNAANSLIKNNKEQIFKEIWTENESGNLIKLFKAQSETDEGIKVANMIFELKMNEQLPNHSFAVLYRTNYQSRAIEEALRRSNIPYRIYGGISFYGRKEIKDILAYFRLTVNHKDEDAFARIINYPARGIGQTTMDKIIVTAQENKLTLWETAENLSMFKTGLGSAALTKIDAFITMIKSFSAQLVTKNAFDVAKAIVNGSGIIKDLSSEGTPEAVNRIENVEELLNAIKEFAVRERNETEKKDENEGIAVRTLDEFLQEVALYTDADKDDPDDRDKVSLMTVHMAKGLEFPVVFVVGLEENLFPIMQALTSRSDTEEERRLFYVAVTRAMKHLIISYAESRFKWGQFNFSEPSRFLEEIDPQYIETTARQRSPLLPHKQTQHGQFAKPQAIPVQQPPKNFKKLSNVSGSGHKISPGDQATTEQIQVGVEVEHERFGVGKVISTEGAGAERKAVIFFRGIGQKQLLLKFARLKIVGPEQA